MKFKYRVKGKVNSQMVLRGMFFKVGAKIDFCVSETELDFVKSNCLVEEIIDLEPKAIENPEPVLEIENVVEKSTDDKPKGGSENVRQKAGVTNKRKHNQQV